MSAFKPLKLHGEDGEDLAIMASCLQDAAGQLGNMVYQPRRREFHCLFNRIAWEQGEDPSSQQERIGCILYFRCVLAAHGRNLDWRQKQTPLSLLTLYFHAGDEPPGGMVRLLFAGDREICLQVEALEVWLRDVPEPWQGIAAAPPELQAWR